MQKGNEKSKHRKTANNNQDLPIKNLCKPDSKLKLPPYLRPLFRWDQNPPHRAYLL